MPTLTHEKISKKIFWKNIIRKKIFFEQKIYIQNFFPTQSMPGIAAGTPCQYFLPFKISCPKNLPFCDFSDFVLFYVLFRNPVLAIPIVYNNLYIFGFCARVPCFSIFALYRNGRGRGICSGFVFILFIFGHMIQKTEFVYYCRKKVKKSIAIKKK